VHHFPGEKMDFRIFFDEDDKKIFYKEGWHGVYLPWNTDKSYTLLAEEFSENSNKVIAAPERDIKKRSKGLALKNEINEIFSS